ncbi:hypothetical protein Tco_0963724, partial [Tanacetum coccineum]
GARGYGDFATGVALGTKSTWNSTCRCGGHDKSSENTSIKSRTTKISLNFGSSILAFIRTLAAPKVGEQRVFAHRWGEGKVENGKRGRGVVAPVEQVGEVGGQDMDSEG